MNSLPHLTARDIVLRERGRMCGKHSGTCHCPLPERHHHGDRNASLHVSDGQTCVLLTCHGCHASFNDLCRAFHVHPAQLFYDSQPIPAKALTPTDWNRELRIALRNVAEAILAPDDELWVASVNIRVLARLVDRGQDEYISLLADEEREWQRLWDERYASSKLCG